MASQSPRPLSRWLLLLAPSLQLILVAHWQWPLARLFFRGTYLPTVGVLWISFQVSLLFSFALGIWEAWRFEHWGKRLGMGIVFGLCIAVVNLGVGFIGCTATNAFR